MLLPLSPTGNCTRQGRQEGSQAGLPHPVADVVSHLRRMNQGIGFPDCGEPEVLAEARQRGELKHAEGFPTQLAQGVRCVR